MKFCPACCEELPKESFSKKQWQLNKTKRRCKECIASDRDILVGEPSKNNDPEAPTQDKCDGLEDWDRLQAVADQLGVQVMRAPAPPQASSPPRMKGAWKYLPRNEAILMQAWEDSMPDHMIMPGHESKNQTIRDLGITQSFVKGVRVGDWHSLVMRMVAMDAPINYINKPALREGDYVEVLPGNSVKFSNMGQRGHLLEYFDDSGKWGIDFKSGIPSMVMAGNLKRIYTNPNEGECT